MFVIPVCIMITGAALKIECSTGGNFDGFCGFLIMLLMLWGLSGIGIIGFISLVVGIIIALFTSFKTEPSNQTGGRRR